MSFPGTALAEAITLPAEGGGGEAEAMHNSENRQVARLLLLRLQLIQTGTMPALTLDRPTSTQPSPTQPVAAPLVVPFLSDRGLLVPNTMQHA